MPILALPLTALLAACTFGHKNYDQTGGKFEEPRDFVIQVDDYGSFWDPDVPIRALETIATQSTKANTIVVLFVHGWHHNAAMGDQNAKDFATSLAEVRAKLDDNVDGKPGIYRLSREKLTGNPDVIVIGIYVGWRGQSLPFPLDYLTFWGRKAAAERVGQGDLREFLLRLNRIYRDRSAAREGSRDAPFMGLVSIGHSFGGQVLFKVVSSTLENELIEATNTTSKPTLTRTNPPKPLQGFGDITVLVNPALEAFQYERIRKLNEHLDYDRRQTPLLFVLSAATDFPRRFFFPAGRWIDALFRAPFRDGQGDLWKLALGEYKPQRTHTVDLVPEEKRPPKGFDPNEYVNNPCGIVNFDLADVPTIGGVQLKPAEGQQHRFSPFVIAYASAKVIFGHSGIFERDLRNFLNDYVAITEGKRMLLGDPEMSKCPNSPVSRQL